MPANNKSSGPGKYKDATKKTDDIKLGSTNSYKASFKSKTSNGTKLTTSQEVKHAGGVISKLSMKFGKCNGFGLEKFDASSGGDVSGSAQFTGAAPGLDLTFGAGKYADKKTKLGANSIFLGVDYSHEMLNAALKADWGKQSVAGNVLLGYENFEIGGDIDLKKKGESFVPTFGGFLGVTFGGNSLVTLKSSKSFDELRFAGYFVPAPGVELVVKASQLPEKGAKAGAGKLVETSVASVFSLDNDGTSLTAVLTTTPLTVTSEAPGSKFRVGLSYQQNLRDWAKLNVSGEVGIKNVEHVAFGMELTAGAI